MDIKETKERVKDSRNSANEILGILSGKNISQISTILHFVEDELTKIRNKAVLNYSLPDKEPSSK